MTWRKEQIIIVLFFLLLWLVALHIGSVMATVLGSGEQGFSYLSTACSHVQKGSSSLKVTADCWGKKSNCKGGKCFFCPDLPCLNAQGGFQQSLCSVLLSAKWGNNAYLIIMLQELCKSFGKCFRDGRCWHSARRSNFSCFWVVVWFFFQDSSPECKVRENQLSFQWPRK